MEKLGDFDSQFLHTFAAPLLPSLRMLGCSPWLGWFGEDVAEAMVTISCTRQSHFQDAISASEDRTAKSSSSKYESRVASSLSP